MTFDRCHASALTSYFIIPQRPIAVPKSKSRNLIRRNEFRTHAAASRIPHQVGAFGRREVVALCVRCKHRCQLQTSRTDGRWTTLRQLRFKCIRGGVCRKKTPLHITEFASPQREMHPREFHLELSWKSRGGFWLAGPMEQGLWSLRRGHKSA